MDRVHSYPIEFWEQFGIDIKTPTDEEVTEAYRVVTEFPELQAKIEQLRDALITIRSGTANHEANRRLFQRYAPSVEAMAKAATALSALMDEDIEKALEAEKGDVGDDADEGEEPEGGE